MFHLMHFIQIKCRNYYSIYVGKMIVIAAFVIAVLTFYGQLCTHKRS